MCETVNKCRGFQIYQKKSITLLGFVVPRVINGWSLAAQILKAEEKKLIFIEAEYNGSISWPVWMVPVVRGLMVGNGAREAVIRAHAALRETF